MLRDSCLAKTHLSVLELQRLAGLREELEAWKFLDNWQGKMVWKQERHLYLEIFSDASTFNGEG